MSFILDALKKSEAERQRQSGPGLMDAGIAPPRRGLPVWAVAICALLGVNVLILGAMLWRQQTPATAPAAPQAASQAGAPAPRAAARAPAPDPAHFSPLDGAPVYAPEIPLDEPADGTPAAGGPPPVTRRERIDPALSTAAAAADTDAGADEVLPEISELNLTGAQALPELHLDVHVWATNPADRFVYINMRKYREGAVIEDGLTLERIRRDGIVLNYQGLRFLMPRR
jgi:general secretion pathway protein B